jgi:sugar-phosphatase
MDGVLIDSEPFWQRAQLQIFSEVGLELTLEDTEKTMGVRIDEVVHFWYSQHPWTGRTVAEVSTAVVDEVIRLVGAEGFTMSGVNETIAVLEKQQIPLGLATSSDERLIEAILTKLELQDAFSVKCSAVHEQYGKPHPAVYLRAAQRLGVEPDDCLVFEDSIAGVRSAKSAGMKVVAIPAPEQFDRNEFQEADIKLRDLGDFTMDLADSLFD